MIWIILALLVCTGFIAYFTKTLISMRRSRKEYHEAIVQLDAVMAEALLDLDRQLEEINRSVAIYMKSIRGT